MVLFWRYGYEATSLSQLTTAMGFTPPSLYTAFGDKQRLFLEAIERYTRGPINTAGIMRDAATAREAVWNLLQAAAVAFTGRDTPPGCMVVASATNCSPSNDVVRALIAKIRIENEGLVRDRIQRDIDNGVLPHGTDAPVLASLFTAVIQGMSTQARDGAKRSKLLAIAETSMQVFPSI